MASRFFPSPSPRNLMLSSIPPAHAFCHRSLSFSVRFPAIRYHSVSTLLLPRFILCFSPSHVHFEIRASASEEAGSYGTSGEVDEAEKAVVDVIMEYGASREDALQIASSCPGYVEALVRSVRELDEHSLWSSWKGDAADGQDSLSFREKVYHMAKEKGDRGLLPFLESVGLSSSSSMRIAGYAASESLPALISKVKSIKDAVFSSDCPETDYIGSNARRMMMQLSIRADEDIQQTLSFFEKMEARRGGLEMLGSADACFPCFLESFPRLLLCSLKNNLSPVLEFIESLQISKGNTKEIILRFPPIIFYDVDKDIRPRLDALEKAGFRSKEFGRMLLKYPWILSPSVLDNYKDIHTFFEIEKVPKSSVDRAIIGWPHLLGCSTAKMKVMVNRFGDFGVKHKMLARVIASSPQLLLRKPNEFSQVVFFLEEFGFDKDEIGKILCRCPEMFASNVEKTLRRKISLLTDFGILRKHLTRVIKKYPELLVSDVEYTLLPRMRYLMALGLSKREIGSMVHRFSPLLGYSIDMVFKPKLDFLLGTMDKPLKEVVEYPRYFSYSLEKKIKPRFWVLKGRNIQCTLEEMLGKNDEEFAEEYMGIGRMLIPPPASGSDQ